MGHRSYQFWHMVRGLLPAASSAGLPGCVRATLFNRNGWCLRFWALGDARRDCLSACVCGGWGGGGRRGGQVTMGRRPSSLSISGRQRLLGFSWGQSFLGGLPGTPRVYLSSHGTSNAVPRALTSRSGSQGALLHVVVGARQNSQTDGEVYSSRSCGLCGVVSRVLGLGCVQLRYLHNPCHGHTRVCPPLFFPLSRSPAPGYQGRGFDLAGEVPTVDNGSIARRVAAEWLS